MLQDVQVVHWRSDHGGLVLLAVMAAASRLCSTSGLRCTIQPAAVLSGWLPATTQLSLKSFSGQELQLILHHSKAHCM